MNTLLNRRLFQGFKQGILTSNKLRGLKYVPPPNSVEKQVNAPLGEPIKFGHDGGESFRMYPRVLFMTTLTCIGICTYVYYARKETLDILDNEFKNTQSYGKADVGGPFSLIDVDGVRRTEKDFEGYFKLIYFGFTHCPDICPDNLDKLGHILDKSLSDTEIAGTIYPLFISLDPARDTPEAIKDYLKGGHTKFSSILEFHPLILGLSGTTEEVGQCARTFRVYFSPASVGKDDYLVDHSSFLYFMGPNGEYIDIISNEISSKIGYARVKEVIKEALKNGTTVKRMDLKAIKN